MEIERKWLVTKFPEGIEPDEWLNVEQFYISTEPEVRLRWCEAPIGENRIPYRICIKGNGTLSREEYQSAVTKEFYEGCRAFVNQSPIKKSFATYHIDGYEIGIALVDNSWMYAEVEFNSEDEARAYEFPWPDIIQCEVTDDLPYKMKNYWSRTRF